MLDSLRENLRNSWKQAYASTAALFPRLSGAEIARLTWAKRIETYDDIPVTYRGFFERFRSEGLKIPYSILTPSYEGYIHPTTEKIICECGAEIWVLEKKDEGFEALCYPSAGISFIEVRAVLLDAHIKIGGMTQHGQPKTVTLRFNTVTDYLFNPILKKIRLASSSPGETVRETQADVFEGWMRLNYKLMRYARRSLLEGEAVSQAVLLPEVRETRVKFLGMSILYRTVTPAQAIILTDRELIIIREETNRSEGSRYGGTWTYVPLNKVARLSIEEPTGDLLELIVSLADGSQLDFNIHTSSKSAVLGLLNLTRSSPNTLDEK